MRERERVRERVSVSLLLVIDSVSMCVAVTLYDLYPFPQIVVHVVYCVLLCCVVYLLVCVVRLIR